MKEKIKQPKTQAQTNEAQCYFINLRYDLSNRQTLVLVFDILNKGGVG
jgi:hypothetical protein